MIAAKVRPWNELCAVMITGSFSPSQRFFPYKFLNSKILFLLFVVFLFQKVKKAMADGMKYYFEITK